MTKEKLLENLRQWLGDHWWALDSQSSTQKMVLGSIEKDLDEFEQAVKKSCAPLLETESIDLWSEV